MGKGVAMPVSASAATSGAGAHAAAKVAAGVAALDPLRRCLLRVVGGRPAGRADMRNLRTRVAAFRRPPRPWKPARSRAAYDRRALMAAPQHSSVRVQATATALGTRFLGSVTDCQPRASSCTGRIRKQPDATPCGFYGPQA